jgi:hypothetical protein
MVFNPAVIRSADSVGSKPTAAILALNTFSESSVADMTGSQRMNSNNSNGRINTIILRCDIIQIVQKNVYIVSYLD